MTATKTQLQQDLEALDRISHGAAASDVTADVYYVEGKGMDFRIKTPQGGWSGYSRAQVREILQRHKEIVLAAVQAASDLDKPEVQLQAFLRWGEKTAKDASTTGKGRARKDKPRPHAGMIRAALATAPAPLLAHYQQNPAADPRVVAAQQDAAAAGAPQVATTPPPQPNAAEVNAAEFDGIDVSGI